MKIGICTFHDRDNYGAVWQAWATLRFLHHRGWAAEIIHYVGKPRASGVRRWIGRGFEATRTKWLGIWVETTFERFRRRRMVLSGPPLRTWAEVDAWARRRKHSVFAAGSDQIWNPTWLRQRADYWRVYLLDFGDSDVPRVSLASSIGHPSIDSIDPDDLRRLGSAWSRFRQLSVREASGREIIRRACGRTDVVHLVDPTLWVARSDYERLAPRSPGRRYVFTMALHGDDERVVSVGAELARYLDQEHWVCNLRQLGRAGDRLRFVIPTPERWLRMIADATLVVTNSYHAAVFATLWGVPHIVVSAPRGLENMNDRFSTLDGLLSSGSCVRFDERAGVGTLWRAARDNILRSERLEEERMRVVEYCAMIENRD